MGQMEKKLGFENTQIIFVVKHARWKNRVLNFQLFRKHFKNGLSPWFYKKKHFYFNNH